MRPFAGLSLASVAALTGCTSLLGLDLDGYHPTTRDAGSHAADAADTADGTGGAIGADAAGLDAAGLDAAADTGGMSAPGDGALEARPPVPPPSTSLLAVAKGHLCAVAGSEVFCLGSNAKGQLGQGTYGGTWSGFQKVTLPGPATAVAVGGDTSCALAGDALYCWGDAALAGSTATPTPIQRGPGPYRWVSVAEGGFHACVGDRAGKVQCWGRNDAGELGTTQYDPAGPLFDVVNLDTGAVGGATGVAYSCAVVGTVPFCWGLNSLGQCGVENSVLQLSFWQPKRVALPTGSLGVSEITAGARFTCARAVSAGVMCWGAHDEGQLGASATPLTVGQPIPNVFAPVEVPGIAASVVAVRAGTSHVCVLGDDRAVYCWGGNRHGQLARPADALFSDRPARVGGVTDVVALDAGGDRTCVVRSDHHVLCWGAGLGPPVDGGASDARAPVDVGLLTP